MSDPILAKAEKCLAAWNAFNASDQRQPVPLYCTAHDEWERQHNEVASAWKQVKNRTERRKSEDDLMDPEDY